MRLGNILLPKAVLIDVMAQKSNDAIAQLVAAIALDHSVDIPVAIKDIDARERKGATLVPVGTHYVAVPHATTHACKQFLMAVSISREGIPWGDWGKPKAHLIFLFLGPPETHSLYLRALSRLARLCQMDGFVETMLDAQSPQQVIEQLTIAEEPLGDFDEAKEMPSFCVLGAGHGGMAMAGHLALTGFRVNLFNRTETRIAPVRERGGIDVTGKVTGFAKLDLVTTDPAEAVSNVDVLMVVVPAMAHHAIVKTIAPYVKDGQILVLNPGRTGGAMEAAQVFRESNHSVQLFIAEAQTLLYTSRVTNPGQVRIFGIKNSVPLATLPAYQVADVLPVIRKALPQFVPGDNVLKTGLDNIGAVFHPAITILNAARIEDTHGDFEYYIEGVTPAVALVLEAIDRERVAVATALGIRVNTAREWLYLAYDAIGKTLLDSMRANPGYSGIKAPSTIQHRYISEDVPASLVPIAAIGEMFGVPTPTIRSIITLANVIHGIDYWTEGRTVDRLGIQDMSLKELLFFVVGA